MENIIYKEFGKEYIDQFIKRILGMHILMT